MKVFQLLNHKNQYCIEDTNTYKNKVCTVVTFQSYETKVANLKIDFDENGKEEQITYDNFWHDYSATTAKHLRAVFQLSPMAQKAVEMLLKHGNFKNFKDFMIHCKHFNICDNGGLNYEHIDFVKDHVCYRLSVNHLTGEVFCD